jgi:transposase-like protein
MASAIEAIPAMPAAMEPGAVASEVARAAGIYPSQLFRWRQQLCAVAPAAVEFSRVAVVPGPGAKVAVVRSLLQQAFGLLPPISTGHSGRRPLQRASTMDVQMLVNVWPNSATR